jgi:hypothetical protein
MPVGAARVNATPQPTAIAGASTAATTAARPDASSQVPTPDRAMILNAPSQDRAFVF